MAAFFSSFRASDMPKQLVSYALSRLKLLDPESLDTENLVLKLGRDSEASFTNVGIIPQRLEKILQLPPTFTIQKAKVLKLKVRVPLDFYTSPIIIEVDGVDVRIRVQSQEDERRKKRKEQDDSTAVPTAADLAQSFLATQPVAEKRELEEALHAETQDLGTSVAMSDSGSEDDLGYGTGQGLSLPAFLTNFLQGIVDRTQVRIKGVNFKLDVEVPIEAQALVPELVTFQLSVDEVAVEGLTENRQDDGRARIVHKPGKRHICLDGIRAFLISETNVFSALARSPSMLASETSRSSGNQAPSYLSRQISDMGLSATSNRSVGRDSLAQSLHALADSEDALNIPYDLEARHENDGDQDDPGSPGSTPRASVYGSPSPGYSVQGDVIEPEPAPWATLTDDAPPDGFDDAEDMAAVFPRTPSPAHSHSSGSSSGSAPRGMEDLAQSRLYSHEEAESMYLSAYSQAQNSRMHGSMPGAWDDHDGITRSPTGFYSSNPMNLPTHPSPPLDPQEDLLAEALQGSLYSARSSPHSPRSETGEFLQQSHHSLSSPGLPEEQQPMVEEDEDEAEPAQEDVATPRGPPRLVKEIVFLESISVHVPSTHRPVPVPSPQLAKSHPHLPGSFSIYSSTAPSEAPTSPTSPVLNPESEAAGDQSIDVVVAPTELRFDASIGFLLAKVIAKLLESVKGPPSTSRTTRPATSSSSSMPNVKLVVEKLSLSFLEKLVGVADTPERVLAPPSIDFDAEVLLRAKIQNLTGSLSQVGSQTMANLELEKFTFGYADEDILNFNSQVQLYESTVSVVPQTGRDMSLRFTMSSDDMRCDIDTLPLHVKLDLQKLDEMLGWFGGLSSFLNMGSSFASATAKTMPVNPTVASKPRGVRFDAPVNPNDTSMAKENKMNMRVNGFRLDIHGKECDLVVETSAIKVVKREEALGVHFSKLRLCGPYVKSSAAAPSIVVEISNTRLEYLLLPKNSDLERLVELITPSKMKFDADNDEIMVDMLLRQRRKGPVLRWTLERVNLNVSQLAQLQYLPALGEELARLGTVAKYLPEDDRPGMLMLGLVRNLDLTVDVGGRFGAVQATLQEVELGHITVPSLLAVAVGSVSASRNKIEELVSTSTPHGISSARAPVLMMRMIDDIEPIVKLKLMGLGVEYRVPTIMDILGLAEDATPQDFEASLAASVANLGDQANAAMHGTGLPLRADKQNTSKPIKLDISFRDCLVGLNPLGLTSKLTLVLTDAHVEATPGKKNDFSAIADLKKASVLLIDDISLAESEEGALLSRRRPAAASSPQVIMLCSKGFVDICQISSARATIRVGQDAEGKQHLDVELRDDLLVMETCADSTQTLISLANALKPPTPPSKEIKYLTSVIPMEDLLASISADAFGKAEGDYEFDTDFAVAQELSGEASSEDDYYGSEHSDQLNMDSHYYEEAAVVEKLFDATSSSTFSDGTTTQDTGDGVLLSNFSTHDLVQDDSDGLEIQDDYFGADSVVQGTAHRWDSKADQYTRSDDRVAKSPLRVRVRDVHIIWNLFDGYDWAHTREVITKAVHDVEAKAYERRARADRIANLEQEEDEENIGDFLFNSIYISIPSNRDPGQLTQAINQELNDNATETESVATTTMTSATNRTVTPHRATGKKLRLNRSKHHKITFELRGVNVDFVMFPPSSGETENSIDIRIHDLDVFDHVPTSTWKKFAMYDQDAGERQMGADMARLEVLNTRPVANVAASEMVIKVKVLPLRLHVDQDALDFITRFFEFKDDSAPTHISPSDVPFIQRIEIHDIPVTLDFKPKRIDYGGLKSGHTTEFMNIMILEGSRMTMKHVILYGVSGFDKLGNQLNDIWMDNIKRNQLPGILAGLAPVRSLVNAGSGFKDLIEIPIREYRKDGRIVRSIGKGVGAFAKTTGTEVIKLGAKLAIGTQYALQGAEGMLAPNSRPSSYTEGSGIAGGEMGEDDLPEPRKQISLYAEQPIGIVQGVRGAYASLARDLSVARDAIIAVPGEVMESTSAQGAVKAVLRRAPTIIFRPAIGTTRAIGQTLLGATNSIDPTNRRRVEAKYKKH